MKRMGSENDKTRQGVYNETERFSDKQNQGLKMLKRQKPPAKSFVWADDLKRQFTYTLKPSKCSNTDIPNCRGGGGSPGDGSDLLVAAAATVAAATDPNTAALELEKLRSQYAHTYEPNKKNVFGDLSIENIFLNSEYFKMKSENASSVSFCSGTNGENRWTIDTKTSTATAAPVGASFRKATTLPCAKAKDSPTVDETAKPKRLAVSKKCDASATTDHDKHPKEGTCAALEKVKLLSKDFELVEMEMKTIEKLLRLLTQNNCCVGKSAEKMKKASHVLQDFIENNRALLVDEDKVADSIDFDKVINNLHSLSKTAYQMKITYTQKGAKFELPRELPISLYADGMLLRNNDFRKYTDIRSIRFFRDVEDGFFPSELWPEHPYGVPFQVTDRRCETFNDGYLDLINKFPGKGHRLGSLFDGKPSSMVYLEPTKTTERVVRPDTSEPEKKRPSTFSVQEHYNNTIFSKTGGEQHKHHNNNGCNPPGDVIPKLVSLKVRFGMEKNAAMHMSIMSNKKMTHFQDALFKKLCERYHDEYIKSMDMSGDGVSDPFVPDFEIHVYGRKPFRLSERLGSYPSECGIVDNCVINITEI